MQIGKTVFDQVMKNTEEVRKAAHKRDKVLRIAMAEKVKVAAQVKTLDLTIDKLTVAQLKIFHVQLKQSGDKALPTKKDNLRTRLVEWDVRGVITVEEEVSQAVDMATTEL